MTPATAIELVPVTALQLHPQNPRRGDIGAIAASIEAVGFCGALIVQRHTGYILAGNHRYQAAVQLGFTELPVQYIDCSDIQAAQLVLIDNRTSDLATVDSQRMAHVMTTAAESLGPLLQATGWDEATIAEWLAVARNEPATTKEQRGHVTEIDLAGKTFAYTCGTCGFEFNTTG